MSAATAAPMQPTRLSATRPLFRMVRAEWERTLAWTLAVGAAVLLFVGYRNLAASPFAAEEVRAVYGEFAEPLADAVRRAVHGAREDVGVKKLTVLEHPFPRREVPVRVGVTAGKRDRDGERGCGDVERGKPPGRHQRMSWSGDRQPGFPTSEYTRIAPLSARRPNQGEPVPS